MDSNKGNNSLFSISSRKQHNFIVLPNDLMTLTRGNKNLPTMCFSWCGVAASATLLHTSYAWFVSSRELALQIKGYPFTLVWDEKETLGTELCVIMFIWWGIPIGVYLAAPWYQWYQGPCFTTTFHKIKNHHLNNVLSPHDQNMIGNKENRLQHKWKL